MKRPLFVFAGQSNMMGACVYPPKKQIFFKDSYEYIHKPKRFGAQEGEFKKVGFPCGEFSYKNLDKAYGEQRDWTQKSTLKNYRENAYFCPSISNLDSEEEKTEKDFSLFSEQNAKEGVALPPYLVQAWEILGQKCLYTHIAKGSISIRYYFDREMIKAVNERINQFNLLNSKKLENQEVEKDFCDASAYFTEKVLDFFVDSKQRFQNDDLKTKVFFWLQGESDANMDKNLYKIYLQILWLRLQSLGFTHFFCIRVGWWWNDSIGSIIQAQEEFCEETKGAYMLTRVNSFMPLYGQPEGDWFIEKPQEEFYYCRDSFLGFKNQHVNEKGFQVISKYAIKNMVRILIDGKKPILEKEILKCVLYK